MATMKAAIYTGIREIEVRQVERSRPQPGQVLLDTRCTGICGSDLHSYFGTWQQSQTRAAGHETCGMRLTPRPRLNLSANCRRRGCTRCPARDRGCGQ